MRQDAQKPARKFCGSKEEKNSETHPEKPEKGETGCVLGAGAGGSGWRRMKLGEKGRYRAGKGGDNSPITWRKWRDGLELASQALLRCPALSAAAGPPCQSPTAAPSPPRCIRHRRRFGGDARHAPRASVSPTAITKNSATANAVALFLAGAEGLEPSARGFGVDVGKRTGERGRASVTRFSRTSPKRVVLVWCSHQILQPFDFHLGLG